MRPPRVFRVMGQTHKVFTHGHIEHEGEALLGLTDRDEAVIHLAMCQSDDKLRETYLHEVLHIVNGFSGLRLDLTHEQEEALTKRTAPILLHFMRDNPAVVRFLLNKGASK